MKKEKLAIITKGGGMNCAYSAGALYSLAMDHGLKNPDILIGSSGSSGSLAYYTSKQYAYIKKIWTDLLSSKKFISLKRLHKVMDIDYLIDVVFKQQAPLDLNEVNLSKVKLFISSTEHPSGNTKYFVNDGAHDMFEILRASKAIPLIFHKKVTIDNAQHIDGDIAAPLVTNVKKAIDEGAKNIIVVMDDDSSTINRIFWTVYSFFTAKKVGKAVRKNLNFKEVDFKEFEGVNIIILKPSKKLRISSLDNSPSSLSEAFEMGHNDIKYNKELKEFIKPFIQ